MRRDWKQEEIGHKKRDRNKGPQKYNERSGGSKSKPIEIRRLGNQITVDRDP